MLKDKIAQLTPEQRDQLLHALENEFTQLVNLPDGEFVGVNVRANGGVNIIEAAGDWAYGVFCELVIR